MKIIRSDIVGSIDLRLVRRPTNTAAGVDNFHLYANGIAGGFPAPIVRFLTTDPVIALQRYRDAVEAAENVYRAVPFVASLP